MFTGLTGHACGTGGPSAPATPIPLSHQQMSKVRRRGEDEEEEDEEEQEKEEEQGGCCTSLCKWTKLRSIRPKH